MVKSCEQVSVPDLIKLITKFGDDGVMPDDATLYAMMIAIMNSKYCQRTDIYEAFVGVQSYKAYTSDLLFAIVTSVPYSRTPCKKLTRKNYGICLNSLCAKTKYFSDNWVANKMMRFLDAKQGRLMFDRIFMSTEIQSLTGIRYKPCDINVLPNSLVIYILSFLRFPEYDDSLFSDYQIRDEIRICLDVFSYCFHRDTYVDWLIEHTRIEYKRGCFHSSVPDTLWYKLTLLEQIDILHKLWDIEHERQIVFNVLDKIILNIEYNYIGKFLGLSSVRSLIDKMIVRIIYVNTYDESYSKILKLCDEKNSTRDLYDLRAITYIGWCNITELLNLYCVDHSYFLITYNDVIKNIKEKRDAIRIIEQRAESATQFYLLVCDLCKMLKQTPSLKLLKQIHKFLNKSELNRYENNYCKWRYITVCNLRLLKTEISQYITRRVKLQRYSSMLNKYHTIISNDVVKMKKFNSWASDGIQFVSWLNKFDTNKNLGVSGDGDVYVCSLSMPTDPTSHVEPDNRLSLVRFDKPAGGAGSATGSGSTYIYNNLFLSENVMNNYSYHNIKLYHSPCLAQNRLAQNTLRENATTA